MCNTCNTGFGFCRCGCNGHGAWNTCNNTWNNGCGCNANGWGFQRICRDCCGNIRVNNTNTCCGCSTRNTGNNGCGCSNGNIYGGTLRVIAFGGNADNATTETATNGGESYYARQYGLGSYRNSCCCGSNE